MEYFYGKPGRERIISLVTVLFQTLRNFDANRANHQDTLLETCTKDVISENDFVIDTFGIN